MPSDAYEKRLLSEGYHYIAGVDEVGRGCLAGPVVAAAVILPLSHTIVGLNDSKLLTPVKREALSKEIYAQAIAIGIGSVPPDTIDEINILEATKLAMKKAAEGLKPQADALLVDGNLPPISQLHQISIPKGDRLCQSISAASIVAKVFRDHLMIDYHEIYPQYDFLSNKGYLTPRHLDAIGKYGATPIHRTSFRPFGTNIECHRPRESQSKMGELG